MDKVYGYHLFIHSKTCAMHAYEACSLVSEKNNGIVNQNKVSLWEMHGHENFCNSLLTVKLAGYVIYIYCTPCKQSFVGYTCRRIAWSVCTAVNPSILFLQSYLNHFCSI